MIAYALYNLLIILFLPILGIYFFWRIFVSGKSKSSWREQLGFLPESVKKKPCSTRIWLHAVSVGEAAASASVISELRKLLPEAEILLSTTTQTGQNLARKSVSADKFLFFPIDLPPAVKGSIDTIRPDVFASMETEIWPNFLFYLGLRRIPAAIVNGIISDKTFKGGRPFRWLYRAALKNIKIFCMQSEEDARRITALGAKPDNVRVTGNTKFDQSVPLLPDTEREKLAEAFGFLPDDIILVAGSTNPGEEEPLLEAFGIARKQHPGLKMIIAPRQIERAEDIAKMCEASGYLCGRRSIVGDFDNSKDIAILDTLGELATVYALGAVAFVGGTMIAKGGHNILQPIAQGKPVIYGPHTFKIRDLTRIAESDGVGFGVSNGIELGARVSELLADPASLDDLHKRAIGLMDANRGASARCAKAIAELVGKG